VRTPKRPRDTAELAKQIVEIATHELPNIKPVPNEGAAKRGHARAAALPKKRRVAIAKKGAAARWGKGKRKG
jgi:hypothetical protein